MKIHKMKQGALNLREGNNSLNNLKHYYAVDTISSYLHHEFIWAILERVIFGIAYVGSIGVRPYLYGCKRDKAARPKNV